MLVPEAACLDKARTALAKNFIPTSVKCRRIKDRAIVLLEDLNLSKLHSCVKNSTGLSLQLFTL